MGDLADDIQDQIDNSECPHLQSYRTCTICNGRNKKEKPKILFKFRAKSDYLCFKCKEEINAGDEVARLSDESICCSDCFPKYKEKE